MEELEWEPRVSQNFCVQWSSLSYQRQWLVSAFPIMAPSPWSSAAAGGARVDSQTGCVVCWDGPAMPSELESSWSTASLSFNSVCLNPIQLRSWVLAVFLPQVHTLLCPSRVLCWSQRDQSRYSGWSGCALSWLWETGQYPWQFHSVSSALLLDVNKHLWLFTCRVLDFYSILVNLTGFHKAPS